MSKNQFCTPEAFETDAPVYSYAQLLQAMADQEIITARVIRCDSHGTLYTQLGSHEAIIPRSECVAPFLSGADRDIAILSCVGRKVKCLITNQEILPNGNPRFLLSRRIAQQRTMEWLEEHCCHGTVLPAQVTHLASFGAFVDLGCGVTSLLPLSRISFARVGHPSERFSLYQKIRVMVDRVDTASHRIYLSHRELLGTWLENASLFHEGDTVPGIVRSIQDYGIFTELTPNLTGLADLRDGIRENSSVSVTIRSIQPHSKKIKLQIIQELPENPSPRKLKYYITDGVVENWCYDPPVTPL